LHSPASRANPVFWKSHPSIPVAVTTSINGTRTNHTSHLLDGVPNNELLSNVNLPFPMPDALQEFRLTWVRGATI
jgi:hypothetical protein